jgi:hypothetical protein
VKTKREIIICEIKKITVIDCLQILEVKDFLGGIKKIMVTSEEYTKDSKQKFRTGNLNSSNCLPFIGEDQFKEGEVILIKTSALREMNINGGRPISVLSFKNIQQLNSN